MEVQNPTAGANISSTNGSTALRSRATVPAERCGGEPGGFPSNASPQTYLRTCAVGSGVVLVAKPRPTPRRPAFAPDGLAQTVKPRAGQGVVAATPEHRRGDAAGIQPLKYASGKLSQPRQGAGGSDCGACSDRHRGETSRFYGGAASISPRPTHTSRAGMARGYV